MRNQSIDWKYDKKDAVLTEIIIRWYGIFFVDPYYYPYLFSDILILFRLTLKNASVLVEYCNVDKVCDDDADHSRNVCVKWECNFENI